MNNRVLFVDDEPGVLTVLRRALADELEICTADAPHEGLAMIQEGDPFAVIVSDMRMPGMDGIEFLASAREIAPNSVRVILTAHADQNSAIEAVNRGQIFRFLTKPCKLDVLRSVVAMGLRQYQLIIAEKELLERTLQGSIKVLAEVLAIAKPEAFGRTDRIRATAREVAKHVEEVCAWELDTAASLAFLGCIGLDTDLLQKTMNGEALEPSEQAELRGHPALAADLIENIPRMQSVAETIRYQHKHFDGSGTPADDRKGPDIPIGARILHTVLAYDELKGHGWSNQSILENLRKQTQRFDPAVLEALGSSLEDSASENVLRLTADEIADGMVIQEDVKNVNGVLLVCQGQEVTAAVRKHLMKFVAAGMLSAKLLVSVPSGSERPSAAA